MGTNILIDLTGQRFEKFVVEQKSIKPKRHHAARWQCRCDCGNVFEARSDHIRAGKTKSCRTCRSAIYPVERQHGRTSKRVVDLSGQRFGDLTVVARTFDKTSARQQAYWLCECQCGNHRTVRGDKLRSGKVKSCVECVIRNNNASYSAPVYIVGGLPITYWTALRCRVKAGKHALNITAEQAYEIFMRQGGKCRLSGVPIGFKEDGRRNTASLDRIDSSRGYEIDNVQWVHKDINRMKNNFDQARFLAWCICVTENYIGKSIDDLLPK